MARYLGIEVTDTQIKGALLKTAYKKLVIEGVYTVYRAQGTEGLAVAARELASIVAAHSIVPGVKRQEIDGVYAALPGTEVSLRTVTLPKAVFRRGDKALMAELDGSVPFDIDNAMVDAQVIRDGDPVELMAAAVLSTRVEAFVGAFASAGLDPREVGVAPVALGELAAEIPSLAGESPVVLVYAYEGRVELVVLSKGVVRFARTLNKLTTPATRDRAVRQTAASYKASGGADIAAAFLCGEEAHLTASVLADAFSLPAEAVAAMPPGTLQIAQGASETALWEAPVAVALAARGLGRDKRLDFRKGALAVAGGAQVLRERAPYLVAAAMVIVTFWAMATWARYKSLVTERDRVQETLGAVTQEVFGERVLDADRAVSMARGEGGDDAIDPVPSSDAYDVLGVLSTRIADNVRHDIEQLTVNGEHVQMQGIVDTLADRDKVVEAMQGYACFPNVRPGRAVTNPGDNRQKYTLDIDFRCPEAQSNNSRNSRNGRSTGGNGRGGSNNSESTSGERRGGNS
jgi:general secretion pathway protein L